MRRSVLLTLAALGSLVSLIGGAGLLSALTDTARTGTNSAESAPLGASADIQLATANSLGGIIVCNAFSENLATGFFTASNVFEGYSSPQSYFCIKNVGSQFVSVSALVEELVDTEIACTGDEALNGDTTCAAGQTGELSDVLELRYAEQGAACGEDAVIPGGILLADNATLPEPLGDLGPTETHCFRTQLAYGPGWPPAVVEKAQSDRVTWRVRFDAEVLP